MEEQPRDEQPKPDDEAEQAHHIDDGQSADSFLHELAEVRHHADGEEGEQEEDDAERVQRTGNARAGLLQLTTKSPRLQMSFTTPMQSAPASTSS